MIETVIKGGTVVDQTGTKQVDVGIGNDGNILSIGPSLTGNNIIDAAGCIVAPGLVDLNSHFRRPGDEETETVESGTRSAILGGYTAVVAMPGADAAVDSAAAVRESQTLRNEALCHVEIAGSLTAGCKGEQLAPIGEMASLGVRFFTDPLPRFPNDLLVRRAMEYASNFDVTIALPPISAFTMAQAHMHEGAVSSHLGIPGISIEEEELMTYRFLKMCQLTGTRMHLQQLSSPNAIELVSAAKSEGVRVTCEVSPHHFSLTDEAVETFEQRYKLLPPLRTRGHVESIKECIIKGNVDAIATCHSPNPPHKEDLPFEEAPFGGIGLETALAVSLTELDSTIEKILSLLSWMPAVIAGIGDSHGGVLSTGRPGNIVVIDTSVLWKPVGSEMASKSNNTPFEGSPLKGKVRHTIVNGEVVVLNGEAQR
jgi:dihydroorotase